MKFIFYKKTKRLKLDNSSQEMIDDNVFYAQLLEEYPNLNETNLRHCINISTTEYFSEKKAFMVRDYIYILQNKSIQKLDRNMFRASLLKPIVAKNFQLMNKIKSLGITPNYIRYRNVIFYARKDYENDDVLIYSLFFKRKLLPLMKVLIHKSDYDIFKNREDLFSKDITPMIINVEEFRKEDEVFVFTGELINESIIRHELANTINNLNSELSIRINYDLKRFNLKKATITVKLHKIINKNAMKYIKNRLLRKLCCDTVFVKFKKGNEK